MLDAYSKLLTDRPDGVIIGAESELPFSQDRIEVALRRAKSNAIRAPAHLVAAIEGSLQMLDTFVPDSDRQATVALFDRVLMIARTGDRETLSVLLRDAPQLQRKAVLAAFDVVKKGRQH